MKHVIRIVVTILILAVIGGAVYLIFFKPDADESIFLKLSDISKQEQKIGLEENKKEIQKECEIVGDASDFNMYKNVILKSDLGTYSFSSNTASYDYYSYSTIDAQLDKVFQYYFAYSNSAKDVSKKAQDKMEDKIDSYLKSMKKFNSSLLSVKSLYDSCYDDTIKKPKFDSAALLQEAVGRLENVVVRYRSMLHSYSNLISATKDFVEDFVFDGEMIADNDSVKYDIMLKSAHIALNGDYDSANTEEMMSSLKNMLTCDVKGSESALLVSYNKVMEGYAKGLEKVLAFSASYKREFADDYTGAGDAEREAVFSEINRDYVVDLQTILDCYGY